MNQINRNILHPNHFRYLRALYNIGNYDLVIDNLQEIIRDRRLYFVNDPSKSTSQILQGLYETKRDLRGTRAILRN